MKRKTAILITLVFFGAGLAIFFAHIPAKWMTVGLWVDISSLLTLISFSLQNVLMLRILAVTAELTFIPYPLFHFSKE